MKLVQLSDLHDEFRQTRPVHAPVDVDVVILAGDINKHTLGLSQAAWYARWPSKPKVIYVCGNHELYDASLDMRTQLQAPEWEALGVTVLEDRCVEFNGVRFLGCTLWSGFSLYGPEALHASMAIAQSDILDYRLIYREGAQPIQPSDTLAWHQKSVAWLDTELAKPFDGRTVVITHFAPHPKCVAPEYEGDKLSPYFVTDLSWLMQKHRIDLWCHGHTHTNTDFIAENGCRVVSNQYGYPHEVRPTGRRFDPTWIIEV